MNWSINNEPSDPCDPGTIGLGGFFSWLFKPVELVVDVAVGVVHTVTEVLDHTADTLACAFAPIPLVGTVVTEASQHVDVATDMVDAAVDYVDVVVEIAGDIGEDALNLDLQGVGEDIAYHLEASGELVATELYLAGQAVESVIDFG